MFYTDILHFSEIYEVSCLENKLQYKKYTMCFTFTKNYLYYECPVEGATTLF